MSRRAPGERSRLADQVRTRLFELLGPTCGLCGCDLHGVAWEVNHLYRRDWVPRKRNRYDRNLRYWKEAQQGLVNVLCPDCNCIYRPVPMPEVRDTVADPF